jgi:ParB-like chromosome segregation protein Spo0J
MTIHRLPIASLRLNPDNPRQISDKQFRSLVKSLKDCPELFDARPLLVSDRTGERVVLGGNMRLRAAQQLRYTEVPAVILSGLTEAQEREIVIKDNGSWGEWDWDRLANEWGDAPLAAWGVPMPGCWQDEPEADKCDTETCPTCGAKHKVRDKGE